MAWGDCWGSSPSRNARELAEAFFAGKARKRGKYEVRLKGLYIEYLAFGRVIAGGIPDENVPEVMRLALLEGEEPLYRKFEVSWNGFSFEKDIARHLRGLGVAGVECAQKETRYQDQRFAELCGKPVEADRFYTLEEAAASTLQHPESRVARMAREARERKAGIPWYPVKEPFVNMTLPLPGFA